MYLPDRGPETVAQVQRHEAAEDSVESPWAVHQDTIVSDGVPWQHLNLLSLDGGGIRGYWSLLALEKLMDYIGVEEEKQDHDHSFRPEDFPDNVSQAPMTEEEKQHINEAYDQGQKFRRYPRTMRYLPCHYFDHICGSSTGGLIAIMLGRFRMAVPDCLFEYRNLGQEVFGKPRIVSTLRFGLGNRHKFDAARLENVCKDVAIRRNELPQPHETGKITFPSGRGLCATFVTTMKSGSDGRSSNLYLIRSYDHDQHDSPVQSYRPTPRTTIGSGRTNTDITINSDVAQRRRERKNTMLEINHEKAQELEVWQVARAATAAKFYFEPLTIPNARARGSIEFTDGGFGQANNPTRTGMQEIEDLYGHTSVGVVVSVGTARKLKSQAKKATFFSTVPDSAREFADTATDPEETHKQVQRDHDRYNKYPYYRLNDPGGLQTELDEWMPKSTWYHKTNGGARTITEIEVAFARWLAKIENVQQLKKCAKELVGCRISRMHTSRWERFATGSHYRCRVRACNSADFFDRCQFEKHLAKEHFFEGDQLKEELVRCRTYWRYQPASGIKLSS